MHCVSSTLVKLGGLLLFLLTAHVCPCTIFKALQTGPGWAVLHVSRSWYFKGLCGAFEEVEERQHQNPSGVSRFSHRIHHKLQMSLETTTKIVKDAVILSYLLKMNNWERFGTYFLRIMTSFEKSAQY